MAIIPNIPWASTGAVRSQERRTETPGAVDMTKEEKILKALLGANNELVAVFKFYEDSKASSGGAEQTTDSKARAFWQYTHRFDITSTIPETYLEDAPILI